MKKPRKGKDRVGERHLNNEGCWLTITACRSAMDCDVQFDGGCILKNRAYGDIKNGQIKNPYHPSVFGIGYIGEGYYRPNENGRRTKKYLTWQNILKSRLKKYAEVTVCEEWECFQNFAKWHEENYIEGWEIDKDIICKDCKIYSPSTCTVIPKEINMLFLRHKNREGYPTGVRKKGARFVAAITKNSSPVYLGTFDTIEEAFQVYKIAKEAYIKEVADKWKGQITEEVYEMLYRYEVIY
jgi:hypothetical protein